MALLARVPIIFGIILFTGYKGNADSLLGTSTIHMDKYEQCPDRLNMSNILTNVTLNNIGFGKVKLFGKLKFGKEVISPASVKTVIHKCASKEEPDTCEYYYTYTMDNFCEMISKKNMPWDSFFQATDFPRSCPIPKNTYSINGVVFETSDMANLPVLNGYWKVRSTGKSNRKLWFCSIAEFSVLRTHAKRRKQKN